MSSGIGQAADLERDRVQRRVRVMKHPQASQALALGALLVSGSVVGAQPASAGEAVPPNVAVAAQGSALEEVRALGRAFGAQDPQAGPLARASEVAHLRRVYVWNARPGTSVLVPGATNRYIGQIISAGRVVGSVELVQPVNKAGAVETGSIDPADPLAIDLGKFPEGMLVRDEATAQDVIVDRDTAIPVGNSAAHSNKTSSPVADFARRLTEGRAEGARIAQQARDRGVVGELAGSANGAVTEATGGDSTWTAVALATSTLSLVLGAVAVFLIRRTREAHEA